MEKLKTKPSKDCPFCGGEAVVAVAMGEFWVYCTKCAASTQFGTTPEAAVIIWDTRVEYFNPDPAGTEDEIVTAFKTRT